MTPYIAETRVPIRLGDRDRVLIFNCNAMAAYETATVDDAHPQGRFWLDTVQRLYSVVFPEGHEDDQKRPVTPKVIAEEILRRVSMVELRALLWASLHEYDERDNPVWPLTLNQVGRHLALQNVVPTFIKFLTGTIGNSPTRAEAGESQAGPNSEKAAGAPPETATPGGAHGIELPEGALD